TDALEAFLSKQTSIKRVKRAVIFAHERSRIGGVENQSVDLIASIGSITTDAFRNVFTSLEEIDVEKVIALIKRDHEYWEKGGKARR
ncbi:MAG: hypothetical protein LBQ52_03050, partial [Helicobacteraceae bacterium]|nr:hypothetical protein [Helicobacteraceae bacterium]